MVKIKLIFNREDVRLSQIMNITTPGVKEYLNFVAGQASGRALGTWCLANEAISQLTDFLASLPNVAHFTMYAIVVMICFVIAEELRPRKKTADSTIATNEIAVLRKTLDKLQKKNKFLWDEKEELRMKIHKHERFGSSLKTIMKQNNTTLSLLKETKEEIEKLEIVDEKGNETPDELFNKLIENLNENRLNDFLIPYGEKFIKEALYKYLEKEGETQQTIIGQDLALYKSYYASGKTHRGYAVGYYLSRLQEEGRVVRKKVGVPVFWSLAKNTK